MRCLAISYRTAAIASAAFSELAAPVMGSCLAAGFRLAMCFGCAPVPNSPVYIHGPKTASSTALTAPSVCGCPPGEGRDRPTYDRSFRP